MILETKLSLPQPKAGALLRTGLINLINNNLDKKLIMINAGAGYGKTTLLAQLVREAALPCVFYSISHEDDDLTVFYDNLVHGLERIDEVLVEKCRGLLTTGGEGLNSRELLMGTLINELYAKRKEELFVILDDYQQLSENSPVHQAMDYFIDHLPHKIHVILASRDSVELPSLAKWIAKQDAFVFTRKYLAFNEAEAAELLFVAYNRSCTREELRKLLVQTEGWITGMQLIMQAAGNDSITLPERLPLPAAEKQPLFDYFTREIMSRESPETRDFLTKCSILEILTPGACDAVLGADQSGKTLKRMEKRFLFVTATSHEEYRCHHLFREYLQNHLECDRMPLHRKAADYYAKNGNIPQSIDHYLEAKAYEKAGKLIYDITDEMIINNRLVALVSWLQRIPEEALARSPELHLSACLCRIQQGRFDEAQTHCSKALTLLKGKNRLTAMATAMMQKARISGLKNEHEPAIIAARQALTFVRLHRIPEAIADELTETLCNISGVALSELGEYKRAVSWVQRAKRIAEKNGNPEECFIAENNLAMIYNFHGQKHLAFDIYRGMMHKMKGKYYFRIGAIYYNAVILAVYRGDADWAALVAAEGWALCLPYEDNWSKANLHYCFGLIDLQKGRWDDARGRFEQAEKLASGIGLVGIEFAAQRDTIRAYRYQGDYGAARECLDRLMPTIAKKQSRSMVNLEIEQSLLISVQGGHAKAEALSKKCLSEAGRSGWHLIAFYAQLALAQIYAEQNNDKKAVSFLRRAVRYSKLNNYGGLLSRELSNSARLSRLARALKSERTYLESLSIAMNIAGNCLQVKCFGGLLVSDQNGRPLDIVWPTEKTRSLFIYMITHRNSMVKRDALIEQLWPGLPPVKGSKNFRTTIYRLRQALAELFDGQFQRDEIFTAHGNSYQLLSRVQWVLDAEEFERLVAEAGQVDDAEGKAARYRQALDLTSGEYLPEIYDLWIELPRSRYCEQRLKVLHWMAAYAAQKCEYLACVDYCKIYMAVDPICEDIVKLCMQSYKCLDLIQQIKACYREYKKTMHRELHCEPSPEMEAFYKSLIDFHNSC